jgi:SpoVK/Ycf46/Vps4 family AAA+-type ATPase
LLERTFLLPLQYPALYQKAFSPDRKVLLYGPVGTGKTRIVGPCCDPV